MTMFVLNSGGQLEHLDMATAFEEAPAADPGSIPAAGRASAACFEANFNQIIKLLLMI